MVYKYWYLVTYNFEAISLNYLGTKNAVKEQFSSYLGIESTNASFSNTFSNFNFSKETFLAGKTNISAGSVWPEKNCEMSIKVAQNWFH